MNNINLISKLDELIFRTVVSIAFSIYPQKIQDLDALLTEWKVTDKIPYGLKLRSPYKDFVFPDWEFQKNLHMKFLSAMVNGTLENIKTGLIMGAINGRLDTDMSQLDLEHYYNEGLYKNRQVEKVRLLKTELLELIADGVDADFSGFNEIKEALGVTRPKFYQVQNKLGKDAGTEFQDAIFKSQKRAELYIEEVLVEAGFNRSEFSIVEI